MANSHAAKATSASTTMNTMRLLSAIKIEHVILVACVVALMSIRLANPVNLSDTHVVATQGSLLFGWGADNRASWLLSDNRNIQSPFTVASMVNGMVSHFAGQYADTPLRVLASAWVLFAAMGLFAWSRATQLNRSLSLLLASTLICDPLLNSSAAHGRVDAAAMGWLFWALYCVNKTRQSISPMKWAGVGGVALAFSILSWPTAVTFAPLILLEYMQVRDRHVAEGRRNWVGQFTATTLTAILSCAVLLCMIVSLLPSAISDMERLTAIEGRSGFRPGALILLARFWLDFSTGLTLLAIVCWWFGRLRLLALLIALSVGLMLASTSLYAHRALYLMPLMLQITVHGLARINAQRKLKAVLAFIAAVNLTTILATFNPSTSRAEAARESIINRIKTLECNKIIDYSGDLRSVAYDQGWETWTGLVFAGNEGSAGHQFRKHERLEDFLNFLTDETGACAIVVPDPNDWLMRHNWTVPTNRIGDWCEDGMYSVLSETKPHSIFPSRHFGGYRVFSPAACRHDDGFSNKTVGDITER